MITCEALHYLVSSLLSLLPIELQLLLIYIYIYTHSRATTGTFLMPTKYINHIKNSEPLHFPCTPPGKLFPQLPAGLSSVPPPFLYSAIPSQWGLLSLPFSKLLLYTNTACPSFQLYFSPWHLSSSDIFFLDLFILCVSPLDCMGKTDVFVCFVQYD